MSIGGRTLKTSRPQRIRRGKVNQADDQPDGREYGPRETETEDEGWEKEDGKRSPGSAREDPK